MHKGIRWNRIVWLISLLLFGALISCVPKPIADAGNETEPVQVNHAYEDTAILVSSDHVTGTLTFQNLETGKRYTLNYDGVTPFYDKYGTAMAAIQLKNGSIADISFIKETKKLTSFRLSEEYFALTEVEFEDLSKKDTRMTLLGEEYRLDDYLVIASENETMERMELYPGDMLTVYGKDHTIYSMHLESGHGYLRLKNDDYFIEGWIEVGNKIITKVKENMLLTIPEGSYDVLVSNDGISGLKRVTIGRNQEVSLDLGDIECEKKSGNVLFVLQPASATLFIDGKVANTEGPVPLEYGIHQLICRADGYETLSSYIKVGNEYASVTITLTPNEKEEDDKKQDSSDKEEDSSSEKKNSEEESSGITSNSEHSSGDDEEDSGKDREDSSDKEPTGDSSEREEPEEDDSEVTPSTGGKIYIDAPEGAEVYVDGEYVGIVPVYFPKKAGTLVVTLRKNGYQTKSYTLRLEDDDSDIHYSFTELEKSE